MNEFLGEREDREQNLEKMGPRKNPIRAGEKNKNPLNLKRDFKSSKGAPIQAAEVWRGRRRPLEKEPEYYWNA